ncbi:hypothetical protein TNCV_1965031 [Trichonephila clavipes]|nr:hypothetical protein TNCV_1965031 [Trichonephila clavipes]
MHMTYELGEGNARAAERWYNERYLLRNAIDRRMFVNLHHNWVNMEAMIPQMTAVMQVCFLSILVSNATYEHGMLCKSKSLRCPLNSSQSLSFKLMSSSKSKLEQGSSPPSHSLSEIFRKQLAIISELKPLLRAIVSGCQLCTRTATAGSDVVQSKRPIFDDFFQNLWPYIGNNTANVVFQMVKRLWLIRIDQ